MDDLISRQAAIEKLTSNLTYMHTFGADRSIDLIEELPSAQPNLDEWCDDCKEYDKERHSCPRWNRVIRETVEDMKAAQPGWIPVTDRLPEMTDTYLVRVGINENGEGMHTEVRTADWNVVWHEWYVHTTRCLVGDIIKWMPIPLWEDRND